MSSACDGSATAAAEKSPAGTPLVAGNGGYDVDHCDLEVAYDPASDKLRGRDKMHAEATGNLCSLKVDRVVRSLEQRPELGGC